MVAKSKIRKSALSEVEIDKLVETQAADDEAWNEPIQVRARRLTLLLSDEVTARVEGEGIEQ
jgi:hypothetical protein